jgi:hypothetical protein
VWPFEAGQTGTVNRRFPQSVLGFPVVQRFDDIEVVFTAETTSGVGGRFVFRKLTPENPQRSNA